MIGQLNDEKAYSIQARDPYGRFRSTKVESGLTARIEARDAMRDEIVTPVSKPQRYFGQD